MRQGTAILMIQNPDSRFFWTFSCRSAQAGRLENSFFKTISQWRFIIIGVCLFLIRIAGLDVDQKYDSQTFISFTASSELKKKHYMLLGTLMVK